MTKNWVFYKQKSPRLCMKPTELCEQHQSHFEELKTKQKQEQKEFTQRLLHDLDLEKSQKIDKKAKNVDKKFLSVDSVQDEPAPAHTHDPIRHHSPIPKEKRGVSSVEQPVLPAPQPRRASLDTQQSQHNLFLHNMGFPHDHSTTCAQYGLIRNICCVD